MAGTPNGTLFLMSSLTMQDGGFLIVLHMGVALSITIEGSNVTDYPPS